MASEIMWSSAEVINRHYGTPKPGLTSGASFWKWDPELAAKFDTPEYQQKIINMLGLSPKFFEPAWHVSVDTANTESALEAVNARRLMNHVQKQVHRLGEGILSPEFGSSVDSLVRGPASATSLRAMMEEWMGALKVRKIVNNFSIGQISSWTCVDYKVDKRKRTVSLFWKRTDTVGFRSDFKHHYKRMPARKFKSLIRRAQRSVGYEIMDMDFSMQPVKPAKFIQLEVKFDYDLYEKHLEEHTGTVGQIQPAVDPVDAAGDGPRITSVTIGNGKVVHSVQHFPHNSKD